MRRCALTAAVASLALIALAAPTTAGARSILDRHGLEAKVVKRVNAVRASHGLRPLRVVSRLTDAADRHASSMAVSSYFAHELYTPSGSRSWV